MSECTNERSVSYMYDFPAKNGETLFERAGGFKLELELLVSCRTPLSMKPLRFV